MADLAFEPGGSKSKMSPKRGHWRSKRGHKEANKRPLTSKKRPQKGQKEANDVSKSSPGGSADPPDPLLNPPLLVTMVLTNLIDVPPHQLFRGLNVNCAQVIRVVSCVILVLNPQYLIAGPPILKFKRSWNVRLSLCIMRPSENQAKNFKSDSIDRGENPESDRGE